MTNNLPLLKQGKYGVLFQNSAGNINMGVWFNDPDVEMNDIIWYNILAVEMLKSELQQEGLISMGEQFETISCYAELHR